MRNNPIFKISFPNSSPEISPLEISRHTGVTIRLKPPKAQNGRSRLQSEGNEGKRKSRKLSSLSSSVVFLSIYRSTSFAAYTAADPKKPWAARPIHDIASPVQVFISERSPGL